MAHRNDTADRMANTLQKVSEPRSESAESRLSQWDAEIEHLEAMTDLLLLNLEDRYYALLRDLRGKEQRLREALKETRRAGDCPRGKVGTGKGRPTPARTSREPAPCLSNAAEDLMLALHDAERQFSDIYSEVGERFVPGLAPSARLAPFSSLPPHTVSAAQHRR